MLKLFRSAVTVFVCHSAASFHLKLPSRGCSSVTSKDSVFMKLAIRQAQYGFRQKEVPIGAVVVDDLGKVIATARNRVEQNKDATSHAEIECLKAAAKVFGDWRLSNCTLYTTLEPCAMCLSACQSFRIKRLVYGAADNRLGACKSHVDLVSRHPYHNMEVEGGVLAEESSVLLRHFFRSVRRIADEEEYKTFRGYSQPVQQDSASNDAQ